MFSVCLVLVLLAAWDWMAVSAGVDQLDHQFLIQTKIS